ncbi:hypothetical protein ACFVUS_27140 [Nocardia sp. NPDC058058]|uniref:hypothetical protein n=1 Tax=Nocardia sp. NPDC058058 TaxID=3346317 RepID=UPI0036D8609C
MTAQMTTDMVDTTNASDTAFSSAVSSDGTASTDTDDTSFLPPGRSKPSGAKGQHYWALPPLPVPSGASTALKSFIAMAEAALQTAIDLLGRGTTFPPPQVDDLLTTVVYTNLGQGETTELYQKTLAAVEARQASLLTMDDKVLQVANVMSADKDRVLATIKNKVADLTAALGRQTSAKLKPAEETALMDTIAKTIEAVYKLVTKVAEDNLRMSGGGSEGGDPGNPGPGNANPGPGVPASGGSGGGDGGLGSIAMMIPMALVALAPTVAPLVQKAIENLNGKRDRNDDPEHPDGSHPGTQGHSSPTPGTPAPQPGPGGVPAGPGDTPTPGPDTSTPAHTPPAPPPPPPPPQPSTGSADI